MQATLVPLKTNHKKVFDAFVDFSPESSLWTARLASAGRLLGLQP
jgi:hypothetical protein